MEAADVRGVIVGERGQGHVVELRARRTADADSLGREGEGVGRLGHDGDRRGSVIVVDAIVESDRDLVASGDVVDVVSKDFKRAVIALDGHGRGSAVAPVNQAREVIEFGLPSLVVPVARTTSVNSSPAVVLMEEPGLSVGDGPPTLAALSMCPKTRNNRWAR